jgi:hypothetical protein
MEASKKWPFCYNIDNDCGALSNLWHVVYATKGFSWLLTNNAIIAIFRSAKSNFPALLNLVQNQQRYHGQLA